MLEVFEKLSAAKNRSVPLVYLKTHDPFASEQSIKELFKEEDFGLVSWGLTTGWSALNKEGVNISGSLPDQQSDAGVSDPIAALKFEPGDHIYIYLMRGLHHFLDNFGVIEQLLVLRDQLTAAGHMLIILGPDAPLPVELVDSFYVLEEPRPNVEQLQDLVVRVYRDAQAGGMEQPTPEGQAMRRITDALLGLPLFPAEQALALSLSEKGMDEQALWDRKYQAIELEHGLSAERNPPTFSELGGLLQLIGFGQELIEAAAFNLVAWMDELEKLLAALHTDSSGATQYQHAFLLKWLQENKVLAFLIIGQAGSGKSAFAKALAGTAKVPLLAVDLGLMQGSHVGETQAWTNRTFSAVKAMGDRPILVATVNDLGPLAQSPELLRRFNVLPQYYVDLPDKTEQAGIWPIMGKRYNVDISNLPPHEDWTGAEIEACCRAAALLKKPITETAKRIIPMAVAQPGIVEYRRKQASGRFLSASYPGVYGYTAGKPAEYVEISKARRLQFNSDS